jgi:beta-glucanase (GH16 family)
MFRHSRVITRPLVAVAIVGALAAAIASAAPASAATRKFARSGTHNPVGIGGHWRIVFDDEFNGTALNQNVWNAHNGWTNQNRVTDHLSNITVRGGHAIFRLASPNSGAEIGTSHFSLRVGEYAEARIKFAGDGQRVYNWPAWWVSGPHWPDAGENDIAEGLGSLTVNYHSPTGSLETGTVHGVWARGFHTYAIYRGRFFSRVYWDGKLVRTYRTDDDGRPQMLLLTMGAANEIRMGAAGQMVVAYVRAWAPA